MSLITDYLAATPERCTYWREHATQCKNAVQWETHFYRLILEAQQWASDSRAILALLADCPITKDGYTLSDTTYSRLLRNLEKQHATPRNRSFNPYTPRATARHSGHTNDRAATTGGPRWKGVCAS